MPVICFSPHTAKLQSENLCFGCLELTCFLGVDFVALAGGSVAGAVIRPHLDEVM